MFGTDHINILQESRQQARLETTGTKCMQKFFKEIGCIEKNGLPTILSFRRNVLRNYYCQDNLLYFSVGDTVLKLCLEC